MLGMFGKQACDRRTTSTQAAAASLIGIRSGTIRQWFHRKSIPPFAQLQLIDYFGRRFCVTDYPIQTSGLPCLASLAGKYIR
jgi:hypothetical protein